MSNNQIKMSREELYNKVWTAPISTLAKKYGLSDVGLSKLCKRHLIPLPGRGYWAKKTHGKLLPKRPKLPNIKDPYGNLSYIYISSHTRNASDIPMIDEITAFEKADENMVTVDLESEPQHPMVIKTSKSLKRGKADHRGLIAPKGKKCLDIKVCKHCIERALHIMDALLIALESRGAKCVIKHNKYSDKETNAIELNDIQLEISIEEIVKRIKHVRTPEEDARVKRDPYYRYKLPEFDYIQTGNLTLKIDSGWRYCGRKSWSDAKIQRVENCLNYFIISFRKATLHLKSLEEEDKRKEEERLLKIKQREAFEQAKKTEEQKLSQLLSETEAWHKSKQIREYIEAVKQTININKGSTFSIEESDSWIYWATEQANRIDPLVASPDSILDKEFENN